MNPCTLSIRCGFLSITFVILLGGCGRSVPLRNFPPHNTEICCFGDSLVFGTGSGGEGTTYPDYLAQILKLKVTRWGTPGDTTGQALEKCKQFKDRKFGIVIVTIGGNDILKRVYWPDTEKNLRAIFNAIQETGAVVVFTGITGPLNPTRNKLYKKICKQEGVHYIPEVLDGIIKNQGLMADAVHPNSAGYKMMAERIAESLKQADLL